MNRAQRISVAILALAIAPAIGAQQRSTELRVDLPILDAPYNFSHGLRAPSMAQSLGVGETFYEVAHTAIERAWGNRRVAAGLSLVLFDVFGSLLPGGDGWVHEEFHRAVLGNRDIDSFDDIYRLNLGASTVSVSHVEDDDLVRLKALHPTEQVRLGVAGIEGENQLMERLEKNVFFRGSPANHIALYWLTKVNSTFYVASGATSEADDLTDEMNASDGDDVPKRDFTGHDFTGWVYDLHRPAEPYTARGIHPSGVGIDRYIKASDLTPEEHDFLAKMGKLQIINFVDLNLVGISGFDITSPLNGRPMRINATASHYLTSFGYSIDANLFLKQGPTNLFVVAHRYSNGARSFPGIDVQLIDLPLAVARVPIDVSPRLSLWLQPEDQGFRTTAAKPGLLGALKVRQVTSSRVAAFVEIEGKTDGWVAGNVSLGRNVSVRVGGSLRLD
jgi:hypothetical protein